MISSFPDRQYQGAMLKTGVFLTHICVNDLTIIGLVNGLWPGRRQVIIRTNAGILLIRPLGTNWSEILIEILIFSFKKMRLTVSSAKRRPFCLVLNVLAATSLLVHDFLCCWLFQLCNSSPISSKKIWNIGVYCRMTRASLLYHHWHYLTHLPLVPHIWITRSCDNRSSIWVWNQVAFWDASSLCWNWIYGSDNGIRNQECFIRHNACYISKLTR